MNKNALYSTHIAYTLHNILYNRNNYTMIIGLNTLNNSTNYKSRQQIDISKELIIIVYFLLHLISEC